MDSAHISSTKILNLAKTNADQHVENYFNWAFMLIIPWANEYHPNFISSFEIPKEVEGFIKIRDISMSIHENFLSFAIDPVFILDGKPKVGGDVEQSFVQKIMKSIMG